MWTKINPQKEFPIYSPKSLSEESVEAHEQHGIGEMDMYEQLLAQEQPPEVKHLLWTFPFMVCFKQTIN